MPGHIYGPLIPNRLANDVALVNITGIESFSGCIPEGLEPIISIDMLHRTKIKELTARPVPSSSSDQVNLLPACAHHRHRKTV